MISVDAIHRHRPLFLLRSWMKDKKNLKNLKLCFVIGLHRNVKEPMAKVPRALSFEMFEVEH